METLALLLDLPWFAGAVRARGGAHVVGGLPDPGSQTERYRTGYCSSGTSVALAGPEVEPPALPLIK